MLGFGLVIPCSGQEGAGGARHGGRSGDFPERKGAMLDMLCHAGMASRAQHRCQESPLYMRPLEQGQEGTPSIVNSCYLLTPTSNPVTIYLLPCNPHTHY